jgi:hypothetical protein
LGQLATNFSVGILGVLVGAGITGHTVEDTVTAKTIRVVDDNDNAVIQMTSAGIVLNGDAKGNATRITAGELPQVAFVRDGYDTVMVGLLDAEKNGLTVYHHGARRALLFGSEDQARLSVGIEEEAMSPDELFTKDPSKIFGAGLFAKDNTGFLVCRNPDGSTKYVRPDSNK